MAHRIPVPAPLAPEPTPALAPAPAPAAPRRPFTDARRRESGTRVRRIADLSGLAPETRPVNDVHAATIDVYPDEQDVADELAATSELPTEIAPVSDETLEARLLYETRAIAERRLAAAGAEDDKPTRRVEALADRAIDRPGTLMGMSPPPPPPPEPTPLPAPTPLRAPPPLVVPVSPAPDETLRISIDLSSTMRTARLRLRRSRAVRILAALAFVGLVTWFVLVLQQHDPGFANTRAAIARFVSTMFS